MITITTEEIDKLPEMDLGEELQQHCTAVFVSLEQSKWLKYNYEISLRSIFKGQDYSQTLTNCLMLGFHYGFCKGVELGQKEALERMTKGE